MSSRASTCVMLSVVAIIVGIAMVSDPRCRGACQRVANSIIGYGLRSIFRSF
jgi:hypothetical protein